MQIYGSAIEFMEQVSTAVLVNISVKERKKKKSSQNTSIQRGWHANTSLPTKNSRWQNACLQS